MTAGMTNWVISSVALRPMAIEDVPQLYAWYLDAPRMLFAEKTFEIEWLYRVQADEQQWRFSIVADGESLAGLATLWRNPTMPGWLSPTVIVAPHLRRRRIGEAALLLLVEKSRGIEADGVYAEVYDDNTPSLIIARRVFGEPAGEVMSASGRRSLVFREQRGS